ncbi:EAL domain-containing protein [Pseudomonadota bacterium]
MTKLFDPATLPDAVRTGLQNGEFSAHYQPKFDPDSEEVVGLEALLRWHHPDAGFQEAGAFMAEIERSPELISAVDAWVLNATMTQGRKWIDDDLPFGVLNVNVSTWDTGAQLAEQVQTALKDTGFPAKQLALECPWRMLAANAESIAPAMRELRRLGCIIVLDGNPLDDTCLEQVRQTPVQMSKVCIKHIQEVHESDGPRALSSQIKSWRRRGVEIVSMGVEHEDQVALSHKAGCRFSQGNRFKSALPAKEISFLLNIIKQTKQALSLI